MGQDTTIDLRSDTVTLAPEAMRRAMYDAPLGDDVYGEDPTVNALVDRAVTVIVEAVANFLARHHRAVTHKHSATANINTRGAFSSVAAS